MFMVLCSRSCPLTSMCCVQVALASEDPSALRGHWNQSHPSWPARTAAEPGAAQPSSPHHHHGHPATYVTTCYACLFVFILQSDSLLNMHIMLIRMRWLKHDHCVRWCLLVFQCSFVWFPREGKSTWELLQAKSPPRQKPEWNLHWRIPVLQVAPPTQSGLHSFSSPAS